MVIRVVTFLTVLFLLVCFISCATLKEVVSKDLKQDPGADSSKSPAGSNDRQGRYLRNSDLSASGSDILGPAIDLGYGEYGQQQYGEQQGAGGSFGRKDVGRSSGEVGFFGTAVNRGTTGHASEGAYLGDHRAAHANRQNAGFHGDAQGVRRGYDQGGAVANARGYNRQGAAGAAVGSKGGHRKGHHSSGFHNSYHKDESGNSSTFYDDEVDNGQHFFYDARDAGFNDRAANAYKGAFQDGAFQANARGNQGQYGSADGYDDTRGRKGSFNRNEFYDDAHKYGQEKGGEGFYKNLQGGQQQGGANYYGKAGEGYGGVVKNYGVVNQPIPYIPPPQAYGVVAKPYYPVASTGYKSNDYYPVNSYGSPATAYYNKPVYDAVSAPVYSDDLKFGNGFATVVDSGHVNDGLYDTKPTGSGEYYGTYRGVPY